MIDIGCLPETPFPHLEDAVAMLKEQGYRVSVDSMLTDELVRGARAGADYLMSLNVDTLWIAEETASTPVLVPREPHDMASLEAAIDAMKARNRPFLADPILDPIPFGLAASIARYVSLRERHPDVAIMMGIGNVTELTEADTSGINAVLLGMAAELRIAAVLTTSVSLHARRAVREADVARRVMHAARETQTLPKGMSGDLCALHARRPFPTVPKRFTNFRCSYVILTFAFRFRPKEFMSITVTDIALPPTRSRFTPTSSWKPTAATRSTWACNLRGPRLHGNSASVSIRTSRSIGDARWIVLRKI